MEDFIKIKEYLFNMDFSLLDDLNSFFDVISDKESLINIITVYGDELSVSSSPEFATLREKYIHVCS